MELILKIIFGAGLIFFLIMLIMNKDDMSGPIFSWADTIGWIVGVATLVFLLYLLISGSNPI
jgi:hypothetical protein